MNEVALLKVNSVGEVYIEFNYEEVKAQILDITKDFKNMVVTEDGIKEAKAISTRLNSLKTAIENRRKEIKKSCLKPYEEFEYRVKDVVSDIDEAVNNIKNQVLEFENAEKEQKRQLIQDYWNSLIDKPQVDFELIFNQKWLNKTFKMTDIENEIKTIVARINSDINVLTHLVNGEEETQRIVSKYMLCLNLEKVVNEYTAEQEKLKQLQEVQKPTTVKVNTEEQSFHEVKVEEIAKEPTFEIQMAVKGTQSQLQALSEFLVAIKIEYRSI